MGDTTTRRSYERAMGKIPLSVILNAVEPEPQAGGAPRPAGGSDHHHQAPHSRSHTTSPPSSLDSLPPPPYHPGASSTHSSPTFYREPPATFARDKTSAPPHPPPPPAAAAAPEHRSPMPSWLDSGMSDSRRPRAPRPSYSEEQKFFIMYARIIRDNTWPEIEDRFEKLFGTRTKGGLTSVYYRVRREWGLMEVLKSGPGSYAADCREVEQRAMNFSREFLSQIGYLPSAN